MSHETTFIDLASAQRPFFLGFDVGGPNIKLGLVDDLAQPCAHTKIVTEDGRGPPDAGRRARTAVDGMLKSTGLAIADLAAIGLCVAGTMDIRRCMFLERHSLPPWHYVPIRD